MRSSRPRSRTCGPRLRGPLGAFARALRRGLEGRARRRSSTGRLYLRRLFLRLTDAELDEIVSTLNRAELQGTIVAFGDIDFPSGVARALLGQSPSLVRLFPKALAALWGSGGARLRDLDPGPRRQAR